MDRLDVSKKVREGEEQKSIGLDKDIVSSYYYTLGGVGVGRQGKYQALGTYVDKSYI